MKRIFPILLIIGLLFPIQAQAKSKEWTLYLGTDITSGNTTAPSGVSPMTVKGVGGPRTAGRTLLNGLQFTDSSTWTIQVDDVTVSEAALGLGGNHSGATFTLRYKESLYDSSNHLNAAATTDVIAGMALSGNTRRQVEFFPVAMGVMAWEWVSGITAFSGATVVVREYNEKWR